MSWFEIFKELAVPTGHLVGALADRLSTSDGPYVPPSSGGPGDARRIGVDHWRRVVQRLGLELDPARGNAWSLTVDDVTLVLEAEPHGTTDIRMSAHVSCPGVPDLLVVRRRQTLGTERGLETGDQRFDDAVLVACSDRTVLGALDAPTRKALEAFTRVGGFVARGAVRLGYQTFQDIGPNDSEGVLATMMAIGERLVVSREARLDHLLDILRADPDDKVRQHLKATFGDHPDVRGAATRNVGKSSADDLKAMIGNPFVAVAQRAAALESLLAGPALEPIAPYMKEVPPDLVSQAGALVEAALDSGRIGPRVGLALVAWLDHNPAMTTAVRAPLLAALGRTRHGVLASWLAVACEAPIPDDARAAVGALSRLDLPTEAVLKTLSPGARERFVKILPEAIVADPTVGADRLAALLPEVPAGQDALRIRYLEAYAAAGDERHADVVVPFLKSAHDGTRLQAITTLGAIGGAVHVGRLDELARTFFRGAEKDRARAAIQAIHARIGTHLRGGVALSDDASRGGVSLVDR